MRLRITLVFTAALAPVLAITGVLLYSRFSHDLDSTINTDLRSRAADVAALVRGSEGEIDLRRLPSHSAEGFAQVLDRQGDIAGATPTLEDRTLLTSRERTLALRHDTFIERPAGTAMRDPSRLLAIPLQAGGRQLIVVVGVSTNTRSDSLSDLLGVLVAGGGVALLLAALAAYGAAAAALRPVEAMRSRAAEISAAEPGERLPVPAVDDEIGRLGVTLNAMLGRLGEALARERRFVADASHELRTPLAILKAELELALVKDTGRAPRTREELEQALASAAEETDRLTRLAEDLLTLAQTDEGTLLAARRELEVRDVLEGVAQRFGRRSAEQGRSIELRCETGLAVEADPLRLEQAIGNLVDNSLRYGAGTVELSARRSPRAANGGGRGELEIHVADRGAGVPNDFIGQAFQRFTRVAHSSSTPGAGLGLSIAASIAGAHGGRAYLANRDGGGVDVWLQLPAASYLKAPV